MAAPSNVPRMDQNVKESIQEAAMLPTTCFTVEAQPEDPQERARAALRSIKKHQDFVRTQLATLLPQNQPTLSAAHNEAIDKALTTSTRTLFTGTAIPYASPPMPIHEFAPEIAQTLSLIETYSGSASHLLNKTATELGIPLDSLASLPTDPPTPDLRVRPRLDTNLSSSGVPQRSASLNSFPLNIHTPTSARPFAKPALPIPPPYGSSTTTASPIDPRRRHSFQAASVSQTSPSYSAGTPSGIRSNTVSAGPSPAETRGSDVTVGTPTAPLAMKGGIGSGSATPRTPATDGQGDSVMGGTAVDVARDPRRRRG